MSRHTVIWGTVKLNGTGKRVDAVWNGKQSYTRMAVDSDPWGGIMPLTWPEVWTFKPRDADWMNQLPPLDPHCRNCAAYIKPDPTDSESWVHRSSGDGACNPRIVDAWAEPAQ